MGDYYYLSFTAEEAEAAGVSYSRSHTGLEEVEFRSEPTSSMSNSRSVYTAFQGEVMKRQLKTGKNFLREFTKGFPSNAGYILQKADKIEGFLR